jgi:integrase/recombinase XerD
MIKDLFPITFKRYTTLPLLSSILDEFVEFTQGLGYSPRAIRCHIRVTPRIDKRLKQLKCCSITKINRSMLLACASTSGKAKKDVRVAAAVKLLERYFDKQEIFPLLNPPTPMSKKLDCYSAYLKNIRGLLSPTIQDHCSTASRFLVFLDKRDKFPFLQKLSPQDTEDFIRVIGGTVGKETLQHIIARLRSFLRFLAIRDEAPAGLDNQIDTPRIYRGEKLPRSLDWKIVNTLLKSIDRSTAIGKRDYSILLLIATYGLRSSEIVNLKLEDIEWRDNRLKVYQRKTATSLILPLTDAVGESIINYIRRGRPSVTYREIFVRHRTPTGILKPTAITEVFQAWAKRSKLGIPFNGPHCLRHSYALHLLRQGNSLKTIGDILGHRDFESTCVYLRLNIEDLRAVPLSLPTISLSNKEAL